MSEPVRLVIAEDEALIRLDLSELLTEEGYEVVAEAGDGDEAVRLVREHRPDVAVLDIKMPGTDGLSAARTLLAEQACAVVLLTAFSQRDLIAQARDAGVMAYVVKPFSAQDLVPAIELARARFVEMRAMTAQVDELEAETSKLSDQLEARKVIDRAKGRLMDTKGLSEQDAFREIQTSAMAERSTMKAVAERILAE